jgi:hypothetical protein
MKKRGLFSTQFWRVKVQDEKAPLGLSSSDSIMASVIKTRIHVERRDYINRQKARASRRDQA